MLCSRGLLSSGRSRPPPSRSHRSPRQRVPPPPPPSPAMSAATAAPARPPVFIATYSGVPVFEYRIRGVAVMRRRADDYLNATHILKAAEYDKPQRTKILEREIHTGPHEKVQGGYGKYQGTWVT